MDEPDGTPPAETEPVVEQPELALERQPAKRTFGGLALALLGPYTALAPALVLRALGVFDIDVVRYGVSIGWAWLVCGLTLVYVLNVERRPLSSIGFRRTNWKELAVTPLWWFGGLIATGVLASALRDHIDTSAASHLLDLSIGIRIAIVITASVTEEVAFRGYATERIAQLTGRMWLAGVITTVMFVAAHILGYGLLAALVRFPLAIVITVRYVRRRTLASTIAIHFLVDLPLAFVHS